MNQLEKDIKKIKLTKNINYAIININYTDDEKKILKKIKVKKNRQIVLYGTYGMNIEKHLKESLNNKPDDIKCIVKIIKNLINTVIKSFNEESALIHLRITLPNNRFKIPRWHYDGPYYKKRKKPYYKFVTFLIGPSTMFHKNNQEIRNKMDKIRNKFGYFNEKEMDTRKKIVKIMSKKDINVMKKNQAGIYLVGSRKYSAFHSEPNKNTDRIFIAILPGKKTEINDMRR